MKHCRSNWLNNWHVKHARQVMENGGLIAYPTEAVMGLGCSPWDETAVSRILQLKRRSPGKGLIVVASNPEQLSAVVDFSKVAAREELNESWPGPVTWLIPAKSTTPHWLRGQRETLAVRVSAHPVVRQLCDEAGLLVSTSANPSGCKPARTQQRARAYFGRKVDYYVPGSIGLDLKPSKIRDSLTGRLVRD